MKKLLFAILLLFSFSLFAQPIKLTPSDGSANDQFGNSVAYYQDIAVVGSQNKNNSRGVVYVYRKNDNDEWEQETILTANDGLDNDKFGHSVAIDSDYILVGANGSDAFGNNSGAAYIYHYDGNNWVFESKITPNEPTATETFGVSVSINGDYALIGANHSHIGEYNNVGAAYIFHRAGTFWTQQAKLIASDGTLNDYFGQSVAIDGDNAIIAAQFVDDKGTNSGAVYIFKRTGTTTWSEVTKLYGSDTKAYNYFGCSVDINGDYAIVGAYYNKTNNVKIGAAYIFKFDTEWTEQIKLIGSDANVNDNYGYCVTIDGNYAAVGSYAHNDGVVYVYKNHDSSWLESMTIFSDEITNDAEFGKAVSLQNGVLLIGALNDNVAGEESGAVFIALADTTTTDTITNIYNLPITNAIKIYPNPTSGVLNIAIDGNETIKNIQIYDNLGKKVYFITNKERLYDISHLQNGLYFINIQTDKRNYISRFLVASD